MDFERATIHVALSGSHAHGTADASSDIDLRGVLIAPAETRLSYRGFFEQYEGDLSRDEPGWWPQLERKLRAHETARHGLAVKIESTLFELTKFFRLCSASNPNCLEILFASPSDWIWSQPAWQRIYESRHGFLSRQAEARFVGYGMAQLKRIQTHRAWLLHPPKQKPTREAFGLPDVSTLGADDRDRLEAAIAATIRRWGIDDLEISKSARIALQERMALFQEDVLRAAGLHMDKSDSEDGGLREVAAHHLNLAPQTLEILNREKRYRSAQRHWSAFQAWKGSRNPRRAELESQFGYDTKHAMHLIRLMRMGGELLRDGELQVRRHDASELVAIREGKLRFDEVVAEASRLKDEMKHHAECSPLPFEPDHEALDALLVSLIRQHE